MSLGGRKGARRGEPTWRAKRLPLGIQPSATALGTMILTAPIFYGKKLTTLSGDNLADFSVFCAGNLWILWREPRYTNASPRKIQHLHRGWGPPRCGFEGKLNRTDSAKTQTHRMWWVYHIYYKDHRAECLFPSPCSGHCCIRTRHFGCREKLSLQVPAWIGGVSFLGSIRLGTPRFLKEVVVSHVTTCFSPTIGP